MGNVNIKTALLAMGLLAGASPVCGQFLRTSYFMDGTSARVQMNPALQPTRGYFNVPVIGSLNASMASNSLGMSDLIDMVSDDEAFYMNRGLFDSLKENNKMNMSFYSDILSFGWIRGDGFWSVNVGVRGDAGMTMPKSMLEYMRDGHNYNYNDALSMKYDIYDRQMHVNIYTEIGLGYSRKITERLTLGGRVKVLLGVANVEMKMDRYSVDIDLPDRPYDYAEGTSPDYGSVMSQGSIVSSIKNVGVDFYDDDFGNEVADKIDLEGYSFGIAGKGFGIDLGATYQLLDNLTLSASVLDLGLISWDKGSTIAAESKGESVSINPDNYYLYTTCGFFDLGMYNLEKAEAKSRTKRLASTILLAGEYGFLDNKLSVGALYTTRFALPSAVSELTFSGTYKPKDWLNVALSYSPIMASGKSFGLALKAGPLFVGTDYMFFGSNTKTVNAFLGISIPIGQKRD